jgi:hypothetical protein
LNKVQCGSGFGIQIFLLDFYVIVKEYFYFFVTRFSNLLAPIWDESADKLAAEMPDAKVIIGKVPFLLHFVLGNVLVPVLYNIELTDKNSWELRGLLNCPNRIYCLQSDPLKPKII